MLDNLKILLLEDFREFFEEVESNFGKVVEEFRNFFFKFGRLNMYLDFGKICRSWRTKRFNLNYGKYF